MKVIITGAAGFLGSNVVRKMLDIPNVDATILVRKESNLWRVRDILHRVQLKECDLYNRASVEEAFKTVRPDCVLHLAWDGVLGRSRNDLAQYRNVQASMSLIELAAKYKATDLIGVGSQAEYGPWPHPIDESTPTRPTTLYGAAKLASGILAEMMCKISGLRFVWLRIFSSYGPKDHVDWMIPYVVNALIRGERPAVTAGEQKWDYLYVEDAADAVVKVVCDGKAHGVFNLGSGYACPLRGVVDQIRDLINPRLEIGFGEVPYRPDQVMHLQANITRLTSTTGWRPRTSLNEGLRRTVAWYRDHANAG